MNSIPWLTILLALPILGSLVVTFLPARGSSHLLKQVAIGFSVVTLVLGIALAIGYKSGGGYQYSEDVDWIKIFGAHYALGLDGIGLSLVLLTVILTPVVMLASWNDGDHGTWGAKGFFAWILALEGLSIGVFAATDVFLFYVFFEATLIPVYFLVAGYGGPQRVRAAVKFLLYSLFGGLVMLASVVGLYVESAKTDSGPTYLVSELSKIDFGTDVGRWLFLLDKIGTFGMIRFCLELFPEASKWATPVVVVLAIFSILYGAMMAIGSSNIPRLIAYSSVSHFGFIVLGIFVMNSQGLSGANLYMFNHGLSTAALFLVTGYLIKRRGSAEIGDFGGVEKVAPVLAGLFLVSGLSALSLPGLSPFVSELLVMVGAFVHSPWAAAFAVLGIVLVAIYILWMYQRTMTGPVREGVVGMRDLNVREISALVPLLLLILVLGFFPKPLLDVINPSVDHTMAQVGKSDPKPAVTESEATK
jgi:NADH-quinone oxidoreductase subunit M